MKDTDTDSNLVKSETMKEHYRNVLKNADEQKVCLNPNLPKDVLPKEIEDLSLSFLCPIKEVEVRQGDYILDIGCGAGTDCFLAAQIVGAQGRVIGIDPIPELVERGNCLKAEYKYDNIKFMIGTGEDLKIDSESMDLVMMNYSFHLMEDKHACLSEIDRVLKPHGTLVIGDSFTPGNIEFFSDSESWFYYAGGALSVWDSILLAKGTGFSECKFIETPAPELSEGIIGYLILRK